MFDLAIELKADGGKFLYEQIYEYIKNEIRGGRLLGGERLPSTRTLADYLQISRSTVDFAYEQLMSEGYIEARPYRGYFVCAVEELPQKDVPEFAPAFVRAKEPAKAACDFNFSPNGLDLSAFPFGVWKRITKNILSEDNTELFALGEPQGDHALRETIARYLHSSRGVNCTPEQIVVGAGNDYLLLLLEKLLGRHVRVAMENPTYMRAWRIFQSFAYQVVSVGMDENGMLAEDLEREKVQVAYVMPSHQYPTGITMPIGRRMELLRWAGAEENRYLIEDDYDSEFRYRGKPIPSLQGADTGGRVIYIGTFSKAIAPAIRISFMVLPPKLLETYNRECWFYSSTVSRIDQRILNEFIRDGYFERYLNKVRKLYREKHDLILQELKPFKNHFSVSGEHAGLHLLLRSEDGRTETQLMEQAKAAGVRVYPFSDAVPEGAPFWEGAGQTVILGYGGLSKEEIIEGMAKLKQAWL